MGSVPNFRITGAHFPRVCQQPYSESIAGSIALMASALGPCSWPAHGAVLSCRPNCRRAPSPSAPIPLTEIAKREDRMVRQRRRLLGNTSFGFYLLQSSRLWALVQPLLPCTSSLLRAIACALGVVAHAGGRARDRVPSIGIRGNVRLYSETPQVALLCQTRLDASPYRVRTPGLPSSWMRG